MEKGFMKASDIAEELDISISYAYRIVRMLNEELSNMGYKLEALEEKFEKSESEYQSLVDKTKVRKTVKKGFDEIEEIGKTNFFGKVEMTQDDCTYLKERAKLSMIQETQITELKNKLSSAKKDIGIWKKRYEDLYEQTKEFLEAVKRAPEKIKTVIQQILHTEKVSTHTLREKHKNDVEH